MTLHYEHVSFAYDDAPVLDDVTFGVAPGEVVALVGPSGAGKSTALALAVGLLTAAAGTVETLGVDLAAASPRARRAVAGAIGFVPQLPAIPGSLRVVHAVNAGRLAQWSIARSVRSFLQPVGVDDVQRALDRVGVGDLIDARVDSLSGGQQQRVALARALVGSPRLLVADEPTSAVDPRWSAEVVTVLREAALAGAGVLVSLHDVGLALDHCDRVVGLRDGRVMFDGAPDQVPESVLIELYRFAHDATAP